MVIAKAFFGKILAIATIINNNQLNSDRHNLIMATWF